MNEKLAILLAPRITSISLLSMTDIAFAQYIDDIGQGDETDSYTLEENLDLARCRIDAVKENLANGSGKPYLDASGAVDASIIAGVAFGGIATAFFVRSYAGKYTVMGRG